MAEQIIFGKISKKINSTSSAMTNVLTTNVLLKKNTSIVSPIMEIKADFATLRACNYAKYAGFCYYIDDVISKNNSICIVSMHRDPLASFKSSILNSDALIRFGPKSLSSYLLDDPRFGPDVPWIANRQSIALPGVDIYNGGGSVVATAIAASDLATNGVNIYILSYTEFMNYMSAFASVIKTDMNGSSDVKEAIINMVVGATGGGNWSDNILSAIWVPFNPNDIIAAADATIESVMTIGGYKVAGTALGVAKKPFAVHKVSSTVTIPWETDADTYRFLRLPKYTSMTLCHPCGSVEIDTNALIDQNTLYYTVAIDMLSGDYYVKIKETGTNSAEPLAYAQGTTAKNIMGMIAGGGTVGGNLLKAEASVAKAFFGMQFAAASPATSVTTSTRTVSDANGNTKAIINDEVVTTSHGQQSNGIDKNFMSVGTPPSSCSANLSGSILNLYQSSDLTTQFYIQMNSKKPKILVTTSDYDNYCDNYGYTVNNWSKLTNITGYVECADVSVKPTGSNVPDESELATLNSSLCSGIYIE